MAQQSASLYNFTLSPGWTEEESEVLRLAVMKYGVGKWTQIAQSGCLPHKNIGQMNRQVQQMLGKQSTGEYLGIRLDPRKVFEDNKLIKGERRGGKGGGEGILINTDANPKPEEVKKKWKENLEKYGLSDEEIDAIVVPMKFANRSQIGGEGNKRSLAMESELRERKEAVDRRIRLCEAELELRKTAPVWPGPKKLENKKPKTR